MTAVTNTYLTFTAKGIREDLTDVIYNISPTQTPFMSGIGKTKATQTLHEWQTDTLEAATTANAQLEGDDITSFTTQAATTRLGNNTQISRKDLIVSGTLDTVVKAGRKSEVAYQASKRMKALKRDMETILCANQSTVAGSASVGRTLASLDSWIYTNTVKGAGGSDPTAATGAYTRTDGTQVAFTEANLKTVIRNVYTSGGDPDTIMVGPFNKQVVSGFAGNATRLIDAEEKKLVAAIDVYESDYGIMQVRPNRFQRERDAFVLEMDKWAVAFLRPVQIADLAKTGDAEKKMFIVEYTLESRNEAASGGVFDLTTS